MKKKRRIIALLLTACMLCSMLISPSYAVGTISATDDPSNGNSTDENTESDIDLPDIIKDSEFDNSGYVGRITENVFADGLIIAGICTAHYKIGRNNAVLVFLNA